jgi:isoleucyl-tRNA synthetase
MIFKEVPAKANFPSQERQVLKNWQDNNIFQGLRSLRQHAEPWSFIDGPITANNPMGVHHGWGRTYKDLFQRFWAMNGRQLRYQNGFDCQGLWVEVEVEKEMDFSTKKDIEDYGLEEFVRKCKARVLRYAAVQTEQSIRLGYWMDWNDPDQLRWLADLLEENPSQVVTVQGTQGLVADSVELIVGRLGLPELGGSYFTFSTENNYMIWTFLKKCWQKGWLYRGVDVMPWCPRCATGISQHEIVTDGYAELTHPSVTLRFPLKMSDNGQNAEDHPPSVTSLPSSLLVWTTTPWTLTSNVAAAVGPELNYARVRQGEEIFYLSKGTLHMLLGSYEILGELRGEEMVGWEYEGPFDELPAAQSVGGFTHLKEVTASVKDTAVQAHRVIAWDMVGETEGTGIVHIAPGCGAEDFQLGKENGLPFVAPLEDEGHFVDGFGWLTGIHVSQASQPIFEDLERKGLLYQVEPYTHRYPTCWRCKQELIFRLVDEWFISMGKTYDKPREQLSAEEKERSLRYQIMDVVDQIKWIPDFGYAREMDWLRNMQDWMISKKRYWGLALPIWICDDCGHHEVIGDEAELKTRAVAGWDAFEGHTPHRPYVDQVRLTCPQCAGLMTRVLDVGNPWLDAGVVPFSTLSYRQDPAFWRRWYPAHWISESFPGQFRNWFYSMLAMATALDGTPPFLENFGYATLLAEDGRPMHKSWGNSIEFNEAADNMGVDVMRWLFCSHKPENDLLFGYKRGDEVRRQFLIPLWNVYSFFVTYANLDGWKPPVYPADTPEGPTPFSRSVLDQWILARLNQVVSLVSVSLQDSDPFTATIVVDAFIDDLTNWYVRRSRRRFWKSEHDEDKAAAYATLYHVLVKLSKLLAPFTPFVTEQIYQNLVCSVNPDAYPSIHYTSWPDSDSHSIQEDLMDEMALARQVSSLGLSARNSAGLKVRQPLANVLVYAGGKQTLRSELVEIVKDELNVKAFEFVQDASRLVTYRLLPDNKILGPRFGSRFPTLRVALEQLDPVVAAPRLQDGMSVSVVIEGETVELTPQEVLIQTRPTSGMAVAADKLMTVAVTSIVTPELRAEGLAREVVRRIQDMRKKAGFNIEDRISTYYVAAGNLADVFAQWRDYIQAETLTVSLFTDSPPAEAFQEEQTIDGEVVLLGIRR